ncbi:acyltransferase-domain-containing protein [Artomyces pyxidatus]|uniref:Acyltransferase-domain-containing protein n=1 Tax=Artomyces pyxidatus TaxID=48021 RepID=A0ACB8THM5_9AGAM|nr:acyltransferase-domain-containing protein [Artomyces pyxidatus]
MPRLPHTVEIAKRPPKTWGQTLQAIAFGFVFNFACLMINICQFGLLPLRFLPNPRANALYDAAIRNSKGAFGALLVLMCQWFAPTRLIITFERDGLGAFTQDELDDLVVRDKSGRVSALNLPQKAVLIANHQVYADWWYAWCLTYFMGTHRDVFIVLKKSLKWLPVIGWGMQFFNFIFLARSWAHDRVYLVKELITRHTSHRDTPLTFILYPEGTLYSKDTRPISKKFADKMGIPDAQYTLLPRSTGLHYSLRALSPRTPNLHLIDITVAYPGIPPFGYGQDYYTLRSVFFDRVPPPAVHMHIRRFAVAADVPIGDVSRADPGVLPSDPAALEVEVPEDERKVFDAWVRALWTEKDRLLDRFLATGSFSADPEKSPEVIVPLELRSQREVLDAFYIVPALVGYAYARIRRLVA